MRLIGESRKAGQTSGRKKEACKGGESSNKLDIRYSLVLTSVLILSSIPLVGISPLAKSIVQYQVLRRIFTYLEKLRCTGDIGVTYATR